MAGFRGDAVHGIRRTCGAASRAHAVTVLLLMCGGLPGASSWGSFALQRGDHYLGVRLRGGTGNCGGVDVAYCKGCQLPDEYCIFLKRCPDKSEKKASASATKAVEGSSSAGGGVGLAEKLADGLTLDDEKSESTAKVKGGGKGKKAPPAGITIKVDKRRGKKYVTSVTGLEGYVAQGETLKHAAKMLSVMLAAGASVVKGSAGQPDHVMVQGDRTEEIHDYCTDKLRVLPGLIKVVTQGE